jgi:hypothetical protein
MPSSGSYQVALNAVGTANEVLNGKVSDASTSTVFRRTFRKYTHFTIETVAEEPLAFGNGGTAVSQDIPRIGDMIWNMYLSVATPGIANVAYLDTTNGTASLDTTGEGSVYAEIVASSAQQSRYIGSTTGTGFAVVDGATLNAGSWLSPRWVPVIAMISSITFYVGPSEFDTLNTVILAVWKELSGGPDFSYIEGDYDYHLDAINASKSMQIYYVELPFGFFMAPTDRLASNALSLVSLSFHTLKMSVVTRPISQCIIGYAVSGSTTSFKEQNHGEDGDVTEDVTTVVRVGQSVDTATNASTGLTNGSLAYYSDTLQTATAVTSNDIKMQLVYAYAYLDAEERTIYANNDHETIVPIWSHAVYTATNANTSMTIDVEFKEPTAALFLLAQSRHKTLASSSMGGAVVAVNETQYRNDWLDFSGITEAVTLEKWAPILGCSIELNSLRLNNAGFGTVSNNLIQEQFYRKLMIMQSATHSPYRPWSDMKDGRKFIYVFNFSISPFGPDPTQPEGFIGFARIDSVRIKLLLDDQLFVNNSTKQGENLTGNTVQIHIVGFGYNVFRYIMGLGGLAFANG